MPELTVFITTYNRAGALRHTLRHMTELLGGGDVEFFVFDDASVDDTPAVCDEFRERVRSFRAPQNIGLIRARNYGVRNSAADNILFLDDDSFLIDPGATKRIRSV